MEQVNYVRFQGRASAGEPDQFHFLPVYRNLGYKGYNTTKCMKLNINRLYISLYISPIFYTLALFFIQ
jgi:hypothetical protein